MTYIVKICLTLPLDLAKVVLACVLALNSVHHCQSEDTKAAPQHATKFVLLSFCARALLCPQRLQSNSGYMNRRCILMSSHDQQMND